MSNDSQINHKNLIALNPTGVLNINNNGTFTQKGNNNTVGISNDISKENLKKISKNEIVCNNIEKFESNPNNQTIYNSRNILLFLLLIVAVSLIYIYLIKRNNLATAKLNKIFNSNIFILFKK